MTGASEISQAPPLEEPQTWRDAVEPLVRKCKVASSLDLSAVWNAAGARALGGLLAEMARLLDKVAPEMIQSRDREIARLRIVLARAGGDQTSLTDDPLPETETNPMSLKIVKDHPDAQIPGYAHEGDAGADLTAALPEGDAVLTIAPGKRALVPTGLRMAIPMGYEVQVRPRSGLALKKGVTVLNSPGTIDSQYRGPVGVVLLNTGEEPFEVRTGDRIAQMVVAELAKMPLQEAETLDETERGEGGFGSTG